MTTPCGTTIASSLAQTIAQTDDSQFIPTQAGAGVAETAPWDPGKDAHSPAPLIPLAPAPPHPPRGGWQAPSPEELQPNFPQYEIRGMLGRGGMGAVYQGWQKSLHRLVAIKILPPQIDEKDASFAERFQREARAMAQFKHPGIVAVHDAGETPSGLLYFVMEYIEGNDVQKLMHAEGRIAPEYALSITAHVCDALAYAHKHGVVHRDIKPSNIMVDSEGQVKVADFGLAKMAADDSMAYQTGANVRMGTPDFMAPETMAGCQEADHRVDIYAVGVMLYQMLTGELPRGRFERPSRRIVGIDMRVDPIIDHALQPDPEMRYSSAIDMRSDLDKILATPVPHLSGTEKFRLIDVSVVPPTPLPELAIVDSAVRLPSSLPLAVVTNVPPPFVLDKKTKRALVTELVSEVLVVATFIAYVHAAPWRNYHGPSLGRSLRQAGSFSLALLASLKPTRQETIVIQSSAPLEMPPSLQAQAVQSVIRDAPFVTPQGTQYIPVPMPGGMPNGAVPFIPPAPPGSSSQQVIFIMPMPPDGRGGGGFPPPPPPPPHRPGQPPPW